VTRNDRRSALLIQLSDGIAALTDSDRWRRHLEYQGRFHRYSFGNVVLITSQFPDATRVAGFRTWQKLGRTVRRGEKAIWILAPMVSRKRTVAVRNESDAAEDHRGIYGFRCVPVFDVSQTEGEELPGVCHKLAGDDHVGGLARLTPVATFLGYSVEFTTLDGAVNGDCNFDLRRIRVERRNSAAQQVKTLAHEFGHALLHHEQKHHQPEALRRAELEAESTAFVVCRHLGLDSADYSFGYVATWAGGGAEAVAGIKRSCERIQLAAGTIVDLIDMDRSEVVTEAA
jgi:antirestriction protein ArdC